MKKQQILGLVAIAVVIVALLFAFLYSTSNEEIQDEALEGSATTSDSQVDVGTNQPAPPVVVDGGTASPTPSNPAPVVTTRPCTAGDVEGSATLGNSGEAVSGTITLMTRADKECSLSGYPTVVLENEMGTLRQTASPSGTRNAVSLEGEERSSVAITWSNWCGIETTSPLSFRVTLPGDSGYLEIPAVSPQGTDQSLTPSCIASGGPSLLLVSSFR